MSTRRFLSAAALVAAIAVPLPFLCGAAKPAVRMDPQVTGMEVDVTLHPATGAMEEKARIEIRASRASRLMFRVSEGLSVENVRADSGAVEFRRAGTSLEVFLDPPLSGTRTLVVRLSGRPRRGRDPLVRDRLALLAPEDDWYPRLSDTWAHARVTVHVPEEWAAVAPGSPQGSGEGAWRWETSAPVRTLAVAAAPGMVLGHAPLKRSRLRLGAPPGGAAAGRVAELLTDPFVWFSAALSPYPFDGFNLVLMPGGAHRVQASGFLAVPADVALKNPSDAADLLAGQWFGERVAGDGAWIQAFAAWQAAAYARDRGRPLPSAILRLREQYREMPASMDVPLSRAGTDTPEAVVRGKGSVAPDMVRLASGNRRFHAAVEEMFERPVTGELRLEDVRSLFEKHAGATLLRSFADWFDRTGIPKLRTELRTMPASTGGWRADLAIFQDGAVFALPVDVIFRGPGGEHRQRIEVDEEVTRVFYILPFRPTGVELDPNHRLFLGN